MLNNQNELTLNALQQSVDEWIKTVGVRYFSELTNLGILMEEVGELSRIIVRKYGDQSFKNSEKQIEICDEIADILWVLTAIANQTGVNLQDAIENNMIKKNTRDKDRHKSNEKLRNNSTL